MPPAAAWVGVAPPHEALRAANQCVWAKLGTEAAPWMDMDRGDQGLDRAPGRLRRGSGEGVL